MYEKISDEPIRKQKVKKLKNKILKEIDERLTLKKEYLTDAENEYFEDDIEECFILLQLKKYINYEYSFMQDERRCPNEDIVIYTVSDKKLNILLQDNYNVAFNFLHEIKRNQYNVYQILNDEYFGREFISILDMALYESKQKEG